MNNIFDGILPAGGGNPQQQQQAPQQPQNNAPAQQPASSNVFNGILGGGQQPAAQAGQAVGSPDTDNGQRLAQIHNDGNSIAASTMAFIDNFNNQMSKTPNGLLQLVGLGDVKGAAGTSVKDQIANNEMAAAQARQEHPIAGGLGTGVGFIGNAVNTAALTGAPVSGLMGDVAPGAAQALQSAAKSSPMLTAMGEGAAAGGAFGATQATDPNESRLSNTVGGILGGAAAAPVANVAADIAGTVADKLGKGAGYLKTVLNPKGGALADTASYLKGQGVTGDTLQSALQPAANSGTTLSLGEALGDLGTNEAPHAGPDLLTREGRLGTGSAADVAAATQHLRDTQTIQSNVGQNLVNTINSIVPEGDSASVNPVIDAGYKNLANTTVPPDQMNSLMSNPTVAKYMSNLQKSELPENLNGLGPNNAAMLDAAKKNILSDINTQSSSSPTKFGAQTMNATDLQAAVEAKDKLIGTLNAVTPQDANGVSDYSKLMDLTARNSQRNAMMDSIAKVAGGTQSMNPDGSVMTPMQSVYNNLFKTPAQQQVFLNTVQRAGGDTKAAQDAMYTINRVINTPVQKILSGTRVASETTATAMSRDGPIKQAIRELTTNDYNRAMLQLTLGGGDNHQTLIKAMNTPTLGDRIVNLNNALKAVASKVPGLSSTAQAIGAANVPARAIGQGMGGYLNQNQQ